MQRLQRRLQDMPSAVVAFSGGLDSSFLLYVAAQVLPGRVLAVTSRSATLPRHDEQHAARLARRLGVEHLWIETCEMELEDFVKNPPDRCFYCKRELFSEIRRIARERNIAHVLEAGNVDDLSDYRPGRRALKELEVESPLIEAGFTKSDIREACRRLKLDFAERPASACLASRIPYGQPIAEEKLKTVDRAEELLRGAGFIQVRVRHHGEIARIEVGADELDRLLDPALREYISHRLRQLGFRYVTVDLAGYRTGSLNEGLPAAADITRMRPE